MGKPAGAIYIDDKAARVRGDDESGWEEVWKEVDALKDKDKYGNPIIEELDTDGKGIAYNIKGP